MAEMRQAVIAAPTRFEVTTAPVPGPIGPGEILLRTAACGICSGDLMPWYLAKKVGTVLGHEVVGWAAEVGAGVSHIRPGDLVFAHHHAPCLQCDACRRGRPVQCATWRASRLEPGGMAEWIRVPAVNVANDCFAVNDLSVEQAVFIEPLACCVKAVGLAGRAACGGVIGCGVMGLLNLAVAESAGVPRLIAVEPDPVRRRLALEFGAHDVYSPEDIANKPAELADFLIVGPGFSEVIQQAVTHVRPGGTIVLFTPTATGVRTSLDLGDLYFREVRLVPSYSCGPEDTRIAYDLLKLGQVRPERLVTHRFPLEGVQAAYETARRGGDVLKVLVTFPKDPSHANK
jgi:L-iditol 2-dehydrogenase